MSCSREAEPWQRARRVLAVRFGSLGDVLMATPALAALRQCLPAAALTLLTSPAGAALAPCVAEIDHVLAFDAPQVRQTSLVRGPFRHPEQPLLDTLREQRFDAAVIFTASTQSAQAAAALCGRAGVALCLTHGPEHAGADPRHEVQRQLALVATIGCIADHDRLRMRITPGQMRRAQWLLSEAGVPESRPTFIVHFGAESHRHPTTRLGSAADAIAARSGCLPIFTGEASELPLIEAARRCMSQPSVTLAGRVGVPELAALIAQSRLLLSNHGAAAHIAAALGTPATVLHAGTRPEHAPWRVAARVLSHDIDTDEVMRAATSLLRTPSETPVSHTGARPQQQFETQGSTA
jgi:ADP-heptose:LPS heptosyltransferase